MNPVELQLMKLKLLSSDCTIDNKFENETHIRKFTSEAYNRNRCSAKF